MELSVFEESLWTVSGVEIKNAYVVFLGRILINLYSGIIVLFLFCMSVCGMETSIAIDDLFTISLNNFWQQWFYKSFEGSMIILSFVGLVSWVILMLKRFYLFLFKKFTIIGIFSWEFLPHWTKLYLVCKHHTKSLGTIQSPLRLSHYQICIKRFHSDARCHCFTKEFLSFHINSWTIYKTNVNFQWRMACACGVPAKLIVQHSTRKKL